MRTDYMDAEALVIPERGCIRCLDRPDLGFVRNVLRRTQLLDIQMRQVIGPASSFGIGWPASLSANLIWPWW